MRRLVLILVIMIAIIQFMPASVEMGTSGGSVSADLLLVMSDVRKMEFGLSSSPVDDRNSPNPISTVVLEGTLDSEVQILTGSGTVYAYWDIASIDPVRISVAISNVDGHYEMIGSSAGTGEEPHLLNWCCYSDIDGIRHYVGYNGAPTGSGMPLVASLDAANDDYKNYGGSFVIYDNTGSAYSYARTGSEELEFLTSNAYPSDSGVPADQYIGTIMLSLEVL